MPFPFLFLFLARDRGVKLVDEAWFDKKVTAGNALKEKIAAANKKKDGGNEKQGKGKKAKKKGEEEEDEGEEGEANDEGGEEKEEKVCFLLVRVVLFLPRSSPSCCFLSF
jgi:hypothetical protein